MVLPVRVLTKDLHAAAQAEHQVERRFLLDVVVRQRAAVFQLLAGKDQALLVWRDAFLVLDLGLHVFDTVARLDLERDGLAREGFDRDLHATAQAEHHWSVRCDWACKLKQGDCNRVTRTA